MIKDKKAFKGAAITEIAVCELCHGRFVFKDLVTCEKPQEQRNSANFRSNKNI